MNLTQTLQEIKALSIDERIDLVQAIWDSIADAETYPNLTTEQQQKLDRRIADTDANPEKVLTWGEIRRSISIL
ncbi:MAG: addiction module protein [Cyanobacteria bacterium P01_G01_bin.54]